MGERATCPVCQSHSSNILHAISNGNDCPYCGCKYDYLVEYQSVEILREQYKSKKISQEIIDQNEMLIRENYKLKTKISNLISIFGYDFDSPIRDSIEKTIKILHEPYTNMDET